MKNFQDYKLQIHLYSFPSLQRFKSKIMSENKKNQMIIFFVFKEKRKERKKERPLTWWPMECSKLNGPWKNPMFGGQWGNIFAW
jgi:hypothetical protein